MSSFPSTSPGEEEGGPPAPPSASSPPPPPSPPPPVHQEDADEDDENVKQLQECSALYLALQECLVRTNRDWRSCQPDVRALKECQARRNVGKEK